MLERETPEKRWGMTREKPGKKLGEELESAIYSAKDSTMMRLQARNKGYYNTYTSMLDRDEWRTIVDR